MNDLKNGMMLIAGIWMTIGYMETDLWFIKYPLAVIAGVLLMQFSINVTNKP